MIDTFAFALNWKPELHGIVVVTVAIVILCGSVYLLLATNMGTRLGFLVAVGGLAGWMLIMGIVWTVYGIGLVGRAPHWKVKQVIVGDAGRAANPILDEFPRQWRKLDVASPDGAEAVAAADPELAPPAETGRKGPFATSSDYLPTGIYAKGGEKYLPGWSSPPDFIGFFHRPHYLVLQVQKATTPPAVAGQPPPRAAPDPSAPVVNTVLIRDQGTVRQPGAVVTLASAILFGVTCYVLHRRDKEAMAAKGRALEPVGRG